MTDPNCWMRKLWQGATEAARVGDFRNAYLFTVAGNIVEGTFSVELPDRVIKAAVENANEIAQREGWDV